MLVVVLLAVVVLFIAGILSGNFNVLSGVSLFTPSKVNVSGSILSDSPTEPNASTVKITLWHDGTVVLMPNNPQFTRSSPRNDWLNGSDWFEFDNLAKGDYYAIAEKDGYMGWGRYEAENPLPVSIFMYIGPNVTGLCINKYIYRQVDIYDNISRPEVDSAISTALDNPAIRQRITGTYYEVDTVYRQNDVLGHQTVYVVSFLEQPTPGSHYYDPKFSSLIVYIDPEHEKAIAIRDQNNSLYSL